MLPAPAAAHDGADDGAPDMNAVAAVAERRGTARVGADVVALDEVVRTAAAQPDPPPAVAGDDVAGAGGRAADRVAGRRRRARSRPRRWRSRGAGGVGADVVALDDVAARAEDGDAVEPGVPLPEMTLRSAIASAADDVVVRSEPDAVPDVGRGGAAARRWCRCSCRAIVLPVPPDDADAVAAEAVDDEPAHRAAAAG